MSWKSLEDGEHPDQRAEHAARLAPGDLREVRVALLRHDARARDPGPPRAGESELARGPQHDLLGHARAVDHAGGRRREKLNDVVTVGHRVHGVGADRVETELPRDVGAIDGVGDAGQGAAAERQDVDAAQAIAQAVRVAVEHLEVGEQVVREQHRLRALQVSVAGHDGVGVLAGEREERGLHVADAGLRAPDGAAHE